MLIQELFTNPAEFFALVAALLIGISIHEASHAFAAVYLGDETPKRMGRLTLNPFAHLDPLGTIFLFVVGFGWGKPVMINPHNFKNPKADNLKVSLAGPLSNFLAAIFFGLLSRLPFFPEPWVMVFLIIVMMNLVLMVFNLIPLPPLDGANLIGFFIPAEKEISWQRIGNILLIGLFLLTFLGFPILINIITFFAGNLFHLFTGANFNLF